MKVSTLSRMRRLLARVKRRVRPPIRGTQAGYQVLYECHAVHNPEEDAIGDGSYDLIGRIELDLLCMAGLRPTDTLVDFGCGNGRLAVHAVPHLVGGAYVGIDICRDFLRLAADTVKVTTPGANCRVSWLHQTTPAFRLPDRSVDMLCAFSVFTHVEHEDAYRYLLAARRVVKPGGRFVFSCLPLDLAVAREIFGDEAGMDLRTRWGRVRNVATSKDMMNAIARMAGWDVGAWYDGDAPVIGLPGSEKHALGQSSCVLVAPGGVK